MRIEIKRSEYPVESNVKIKSVNVSKIVSDVKKQFELRRWYEDLMKTKKCEHCSCNNIIVLLWHHLDPKTKKYEIARMVSLRMSKESIIEEMNKCIVLCCNCHRIIHSKRKTIEENISKEIQKRIANYKPRKIKEQKAVNARQKPKDKSWLLKLKMYTPPPKTIKV